MTTRNPIEKLFEGEDLPDVSQREALPLISPDAYTSSETRAAPEAESKADNPSTRRNDKRIFTRVDVSEKKLELRFHTELQFARQYIENISLGGLFVRTEARHPIGTILPIEFAIPSVQNQEPQNFVLKARVCRVTDDGLGFEFTNLSPELRQHLEAYVRSVLPQGASLINPKARQASIDRLEELRSKRSLQEATRKRRFIQGAVILGLFLLNSILVREVVVTEQKRAQQGRSGTVVLKGETISESDVRTVRRDSDGKFRVQLANGKEFVLSRNELESSFPSHWVKNAQRLSSLEPQKKVRRAKNTNLSNIRSVVDQRHRRK